MDNSSNIYGLTDNNLFRSPKLYNWDNSSEVIDYGNLFRSPKLYNWDNPSEVIDYGTVNNYGNGISSSFDSSGLAYNIYNLNNPNSDPLNLAKYYNLNGDKNKDFLDRLMEGDRGALNTALVGLNLGQLGLGLAAFLQQKDYMQKQGRLLDQQLEHNRYEMTQRKAMNDALANRPRV